MTTDNTQCEARILEEITYLFGRADFQPLRRARPRALSAGGSHTGVVTFRPRRTSDTAKERQTVHSVSVSFWTKRTSELGRHTPGHDGTHPFSPARWRMATVRGCNGNTARLKEKQEYQARKIRKSHKNCKEDLHCRWLSSMRCLWAFRFKMHQHINFRYRNVTSCQTNVWLGLALSGQVKEQHKLTYLWSPMLYIYTILDDVRHWSRQESLWHRPTTKVGG